MLRPALTILWLVLLGSGFAAVTKKTSVYAARNYRLLEPPPLTRLDTRFLDIVTFGYRGLYDDFADIWTLQILTDKGIARQDPAAVDATIRSVTRHGPKIESLYLASCFVLAFDLKRPDYCERITLDGLKALPESWLIPEVQGYLEASLLHDPKSAAMYYGLSASRPDAPEFLQKLAADLIQKKQLSPDELQSSLEQLLGGSGGAKFGEFLQKKAKSEQN